MDAATDQRRDDGQFMTPNKTSRAILPFNLQSVIPKLTPALFIRAPWSSPSSSPASSAAASSLEPASSSARRNGDGGLLENPLTTVEIQKIIMRRIANFSLPDDAHTHLAESTTDFITTTTSLFAKLYFISQPNVRSILETHKFINYIIFSQLQPLRILQIPLLRFIRPLQWLLAPFASFTTPVVLKFASEKILSFAFPLFYRVHNYKRKRSSGQSSNRQRLRSRSSAVSRNTSQNVASSSASASNRPAIVDDIVGAVYNFGEKTVSKLKKTRNRAKERVSKLEPLQALPPPLPKQGTTSSGSPIKPEGDTSSDSVDAKRVNADEKKVSGSGAGAGGKKSTRTGNLNPNVSNPHVDSVAPKSEQDSL